MIVFPRPEWRRALYRFRHLIAAVAVLAALMIVVRVFAPGIAVYALAADTPAGTVLDANHLRTIRIPQESLPSGHFSDSPVGLKLMMDLPARTILTEHIASAGTLAQRAPSNTLVFPITLADAGSLALAEPGSVVSLIAADPFDGGTRVVDDVHVIAVFEEASGSLLGATGSHTAVAVVAVPRNHANFIMSASGSTTVRVAVSQ